jgi:hypothetical protein
MRYLIESTNLVCITSIIKVFDGQLHFEIENLFEICNLFNLGKMTYL